MLCPVEDLLSKDNLKSAIVLTVLQFHFRINAYFYMLRTIVDRTLDVVFCSGVILETIYCILYIIIYYTQCVSMYCKAPIRKRNYFASPYSL